ncbi:MAG: S9 family peptidase [Oscillospiraceae bacterium]|nr:S9 family peptidase [Oscillospiraceae bacterium]
MKPVQTDEFCRLRFISGVTISPRGGSACAVVSEADREKNEYRSDLWSFRGGKWTRLTSSGNARSFFYLDEETIIFPSLSGKDVKGAGSLFRRISLNGGEATDAYSFPIPVSRLLPLPNGDFIAAGTVTPGFEKLYMGGGKLTEEYKKHLEEEADYEVLLENPWWHNGSGHSKGTYTSLFMYRARSKKLSPLTAGGIHVSKCALSRDNGSVWFLSSPVKPRRTLTGETCLCRLDLRDLTIRTVLSDSDGFRLQDFEPGDGCVFVLASDGRYGLNTDPDFYRLDEKTEKTELLARYGESIGSSVGSDVRYGGGRSMKADGDTLYFISTRFDGAYLYKLENGAVSRVLDRPGSVDSFDVLNGRIMAVALWDMRPQEVYDGTGKRLSGFNSAALRGKYVAVPEPLEVDRGSYSVHGFVLKPMGYDPAKKYPVILDIHGGPKTVYGPVFCHEMQYWAGKGYFVIFCNPTGSDGRGPFMDIRGKYGDVDYEDIMAFTDSALEAWPAMDRNNLFETGGSYGGFMTNWIIGHTDRFRACASQRSISNWFSFWGVSDIGVEFGSDQCAADPWSAPEKLWSQSPLKYADRVRTPTLFIHSFEDYRCPIDQGYQMFTALLEHGVESRMVCFRGENHELSRSGKPSHRIRRLSEITNWFETHRV